MWCLRVSYKDTKRNNNNNKHKNVSKCFDLCTYLCVYMFVLLFILFTGPCILCCLAVKVVSFTSLCIQQSYYLFLMEILEAFILLLFWVFGHFFGVISSQNEELQQMDNSTWYFVYVVEDNSLSLTTSVKRNTLWCVLTFWRRVPVHDEPSANCNTTGDPKEAPACLRLRRPREPERRSLARGQGSLSPSTTTWHLGNR